MNFIVVVLMLASACTAFAQAPSQRELDEMVKKAQEAVRNIDPQTKRMLDSMGVKLPQVKQMPKGAVTDKQLAEAWDAQTNTIPKKDGARIALIPKAPLTDAALPAFVKKVQAAVSLKLDAATRSTAEQVYATAKKEQQKNSVANAATGLWINGNAPMAVYLMGKATADDPANEDNVNNYAAFLTMTGAEEAAIPLLMNLYGHFPGNSTILNNLGQAWFGLGQLAKASKYLDSAILIYALHPQANYTKCLLLEKTDPVKSIEALKRSIAGAYSKEKESKLRELKYELQSEDLRWDFPMMDDALGLQRFFLPAYPTSPSQSPRLQQEWIAFRKACKQKIDELEAKNAKLRIEIEEQAKQTYQEMLHAVNTKQRFTQPPLIPFYHNKAMKKLIYLVNDKDGAEAYNRQRIAKAQEAAGMRVLQLQKKMNDELLKLPATSSDGEGAGNQSDEEYCNKANAIIARYLDTANKLLRSTRAEALEFQRKILNNQAYFNLFIMDPLTYEYTKNGYKINWLQELSKSQVEFWRCRANTPKDDEVQTGSIPDFDDVHCDRHVEFNFFSTRLSLDCSRLTSEIKLPVLKLSLKENLNSNQIMKGTLEVGYFMGTNVSLGPFSGEYKAEAGVTMEFDKSGVTDVGVRGKAMAGDKVGGMDIRYGWNAGGSTVGKGFFRGIRI